MKTSPVDPEARTRKGAFVALFFVALVIIGFLGVRPVVQNDGDATALLRTGRYSASREVIDQDFDDPVLTPDYGHDGQQFYVLSRTLPDLHDAKPNVDHLSYRARRILLPLLAWPFPDGYSTVWAMFAINVIAVGLAAVGVGILATRVGVSPWIGLTVAITPAMVESVQGVLGDAPAFCLCVWALVLRRNHVWLMAGALALAALSRETSLVVAVALFIVGSARERLAVAAGVAGWFVIAGGLTVWLTSDRQALGQWSWPLTALADEGFSSNSFLLAVVLVGASAFAAWVLRSSLPEVAWWVAIDALLVVIVDDSVTSRPQNLGRVAPMAIPALAIAAAVVARSRRATHAMPD